VQVEQIDIFQLQQEQSPVVPTTDKLFSVSYYDYNDCFFFITFSATDKEIARQKVLRGEEKHPKAMGCLRTWRVREIK
jgi:hypothetical protein